MACEWCVLIKEDKDNSLQFNKVSPATVLHCTVQCVNLEIELEDLLCVMVKFYAL